VAGLEWAVTALEELLVLGAWIGALRARHAGAGINTHALSERLARLEELLNVLYEYIEGLEEA